MPDLPATSSPKSRGERFAVTPMKVIKVSSPLDKTLTMKMATWPASALTEVGDATPLPPLLVDEPNIGIASTPGPHAEVSNAMSLLTVDRHAFDWHNIWSTGK